MSCMKSPGYEILNKFRGFVNWFQFIFNFVEKQVMFDKVTVNETENFTYNQSINQLRDAVQLDNTMGGGWFTLGFL